MVLRDIDLIEKLKNKEVGLTITTTDDKISRFLEVNASATFRRFETLKELGSSGIETYAFLGPLLPHFQNKLDELETLIERVAECGVKNMFVEHMNMKRYIRERLEPQLIASDADTRMAYDVASMREGRNQLEENVYKLLEKYDLSLRLNEVLVHNGA